MDLKLLGRQTWALTRKNFIVTVLRKWISTLIRALILPILLLVLLLEIQNFTKDDKRYGFGSPNAVRDLADTIPDDQKIVFVQTPGLGPDFGPVYRKITGPLRQESIIELDNLIDVDNTCPVDFHGKSPCYAVVIFNDTPESGRPGAHWNYTIQTDPSNTAFDPNPFTTDNPMEQIFLPLQVAVENAITGSDTKPEVLKYTSQGTQEQADELKRQNFIVLALYILSFVFFMTMMPASHHVSSMIAADRESGMSELIDAMGGGAAIPRVLSHVITFDILYLPLWIILGVLFQVLLVPTTSAAIPIFWQILTGWAVTSSSIFAAAFFKKTQIAAIFVSLVGLLLGILAAYQENMRAPPPLAQVAVLSFLFPPMNYVFFFNFMAKAELARRPLDLARPIPAEALQEVLFSQRRETWVSQAPPYFLLVLLVLQIVGYALLAVLVEHLLHGNNRKHRDFGASPGADHLAVHTSSLTKYYYPSWFKRWCCCSRKPTVKAVDGLDLQSQKNQILCLLGPNGSGKTTTLNMLAGFQAPSGGSINIDSLPSKLGVCPQKNVLFNNLTVYEHLVLWNTLKGNPDDRESLEKLIGTCDLARKRDSFSRNLSGGMKRKLQLACMLVGGSSICLLDEVTSGVDPLSRRVIWNAILAERSHRTMILTTHFLDESEVLSDHIVILSLGKTKCQGTPAELKNEYGGGYRVHMPRSQDISRIPYPLAEKQGHYICTVPDSASAAQVLATLDGSHDNELYITGPTIEDVFLKVSEDPHALAAEKLADDESIEDDSQPSQPVGSVSEIGILFRQMRALLLKRIIILRSTWWVYFFAMAIPIVSSPFLYDFLKDYEMPRCNELVANAPYTEDFSTTPFGLVLGPQSVNDTVVGMLDLSNPYFEQSDLPHVENSRDGFVRFIETHPENATTGGMYLSNDSSGAAPPLIAVPIDWAGVPRATSLTNLVSLMQSGMNISGSHAELKTYREVDGGDSLIWVTIFCLLHALYPAFFALYPTYERKTQVRELQYSNGIRPPALVLSYALFDFCFVLVVSILCTAIVSAQAPWFGIGHVFLVQALYGLAAIPLVYLIALMTSSQPAAFASSVLAMAIMYIIATVVSTVTQAASGGSLATQDGLNFGLGLVFPIQNLVTAMSVGLNTNIIRCRGSDMVVDPSSIYAYGGPIMLLILQIIALFGLLLWVEGGAGAFAGLAALVSGGRKGKGKASTKDGNNDVELTELGKGGSTGRSDVDAEAARVEASSGDLLRMLHVSKRFGANTAVDDVSLGLREGEILALLGPNGAGKTTAINMIRGDLTPTEGSIYLEGVDVHRNTRLAQQYLGVCPQFDALDLLTVREHLFFYARCKGVADVKGDVEWAMRKVGITAHASKMASKLSGGNKRKLSLAIALLGNPPVLLLDEPSSAMDAASKRVLWKTLEAVSPGRSVLITTHSMEEADALASRAAIVARRMLAIGTTQELRKAHSNEYHVDLILRSAPLSPPEEMNRVADWVRRAFPDVKFEGQNLGGQVRFIVPADSQAPATATSSHSDAPPPAPSFVRYLIEMLERNKQALGVDCYSIGAATMERVFLSVVKESDAVEEEGGEKQRWWH